MSVQQILEKPHYRKTFYVILVLLLVVLILVRQFVLGPWIPDAASWRSLALRLVEGLLSSTIVTVFLGALLFLLTPPAVRLAQMRIVEPREIGRSLEQALLATTAWRYRGNCGRYLRAVTLPGIARSARKRSAAAEVYVLLLDPTALEACERYALYRGGVRSASSERLDPWTREKVQRESLATVIAVLATQQAEPLLAIRLGLLASFSTFRLDLSDDRVLITKEDRLAPAVACDKGTFFYESYRDEIALVYGQSRQVRSPKTFPPVAELDLVSARTILKEVGLDPTSLSDEVIQSAIKSACAPRSPYD